MLRKKKESRHYNNGFLLCKENEYSFPVSELIIKGHILDLALQSSVEMTYQALTCFI